MSGVTGGAVGYVRRLILRVRLLNHSDLPCDPANATSRVQQEKPGSSESLITSFELLRFVSNQKTGVCRSIPSRRDSPAPDLLPKTCTSERAPRARAAERTEGLLEVRLQSFGVLLPAHFFIKIMKNQ